MTTMKLLTDIEMNAIPEAKAAFDGIRAKSDA